MAIGASSYGTVAEVAALTPQYTASGSYGATTRPTTTQVEQFIDRVSAIVNVLLAREGFAIPVTQADAKLALTHFVVEECADLCEAVNRSGRFFLPEGELRSRGRFRVIFDDCQEFIEVYAAGLEELGVTRDRRLTYGLNYTSTDDGGDDLEPIFQREWMGQDVIDWDS